MRKTGWERYLQRIHVDLLQNFGYRVAPAILEWESGILSHNDLGNALLLYGPEPLSLESAWAGASGLGHVVERTHLEADLDHTLSVTPQGLGTGVRVPGVRTA